MRIRARYLGNQSTKIITVNKNCPKSVYLQSQKETVLKTKKEKVVRETWKLHKDQEKISKALKLVIKGLFHFQFLQKNCRITLKTTTRTFLSIDFSRSNNNWIAVIEMIFNSYIIFFVYIFPKSHWLLKHRFFQQIYFLTQINLS